MSDLADKPKDTLLDSTETNKVKYDAKRNGVSSVTVFLADRAEIKRSIKVSLKAGQNDVEITHLPTCLEESSIRVDGIGNARIFDVIYHAAPPVDNIKRNEAFKELEEQKEKLTSELNIVNRQSEMLTEYSKTLTSKDASAEQLESFLELYGTRQTKLDERKTELEESLAKLEEKFNEKRKELDMDDESLNKTGVRVTVVVLADSEGDAELCLTYLVSSASWTPQYDLRANIAPDTKGENAVTIHYRASITQMTGEDWTSVDLTLSTASPLQGTDIPSLEPLWISQRVRTKQTARKSTAFLGGSAQPGAVMAMAMAPPPPAGFFGVRTATANEGAICATFAIPGLSTIPSDNPSSQQTHRVSIAELDFPSVDLEWISVPKESPSAFLRCKVKNTTKYLLLPGQANVFMNNNFVAKSQIPHVSPQESFSCSLGVDPAIRVTYHPQTKRVKSSGTAVLSLSNKTTTTTFEQSITIKNTRQSRVHRLLLQDQVPVSSNSSFKVNLLEPRSLAAATKGGKNVAVPVMEGVRAQWASRREEDGDSKVLTEDLTMDSAQGLLEWVIEMEPSASLDVKVGWEVTAAVGDEWVVKN